MRRPLIAFLVSPRKQKTGSDPSNTCGELDLHPATSRLEQLFEQFRIYDVDFGDVRGQESAKRAMTPAAAGRHILIMIGPPGSGEPEDMA